MPSRSLKGLVAFGLASSLALFNSSQGQQTAEFESTYGGPWSDGARTLTTLSDGGFVLGGWKTVEGRPGFTEGWLVRLDARGRYQWDVPVSGTGKNGIWAITPALDGGLFAISDTSDNPSSNTRLSKFSSGGGLEWVRTFGGPNQDSARAIRPTLDGGLILAGRTSLADKSETKGWVVKLDADLEAQWIRTIGPSAFSTISDISVTVQGDFVTVGTATRADGQTLGWAVKLGPFGGEIWEQRFDWADLTRLDAAYPLKDGGAVFLGTQTSSIPESDSRIVVFRVSSEGSVEWTVQPAISGTHTAAGLGQRTDGLLTAAFNYTQDRSSGVAVALISLAGDLISVTRHPALNQRNAKAMAVYGPLGYAIAGTAKATTATNEDAWFKLSAPINQSTISPEAPGP